MGTIIVILLAILAYKKRVSGDKVTYFLIIHFLLLKCYYVSICATSAIRGDDAALLLIIYFYLSTIKDKSNYYEHYKLIMVFVIFLIASFFVSIYVYELQIIDAIKGVRTYLAILLLPDICSLSKVEIRSFLYKVSIITAIFGVLYITQNITKVGILRDLESDSQTMTGFLGLRRYYSTPPGTSIAFFFSLFLMNKFDKHRKIILVISALTILFAQSRGYIFSTFLTIAIVSFFSKVKGSKRFAYALFVVLIALFIKNTILSGETGKKTANDFELLTSGGAKDLSEVSGDATFTYRLALLTNTIEALSEGSTCQKIFGFGLFSSIEMTDAIRMGITKVTLFTDFDNKVMMNTPDIAYVNILNSLGYLGGALYFLFWFYYIRDLNRYRRSGNLIAVLGFASIISSLISGLNGSGMTTPTSLFFIALLCHYSKLIRNESSTY